MFTLPLTPSEYHELLDVKYRPDSSSTAGWALRDPRGRIYGWHPRQPGSTHWAHCNNAFAAFIPSTRRRQHLTRLGHTVTITAGIDDLAALLRRARGDAEDPQPAHDGHPDEEAMFEL